MIREVDHTNIVVSDLARSVQFYTDVLGFEKIREAHLQGEWIDTIVGLRGVSATVVYVQPPAGGPRIELIRYHTPHGAVLPQVSEANTVGLRHVALRVSDIESVCKWLEAAGVELLGPPITVPDGVVKHDAGTKTLCYCRDPDGVLLEIAEYKPEAG